VTLWSGRFSEEPADVLWSYTVDRRDARLLPYDIEASRAHAGALRAAGLLGPEDHQALDAALRALLDEARAGSFLLGDEDEDVHSAVERRLVAMVGEVGERLHAGRSRNDQVATDLRLYLRDACVAHEGRLAGFVGTLADRAEAVADVVVPAHTHLQQAQAVPLGHLLLAHAWPALRDRSRFFDLRARLDESPLGAAAGAGSTLPLDPAESARRLGFATTARNSIDAVASRDLAAEFVWCCAQAMIGLSRLTEELVLWTSTEFGWASLPDAMATGSSALPHKRNPDLAELARGRAAGAIGDLTAILALQKGLPLAYHRDLQEDKVHVFRADDTLAATVTALNALVSALRFTPPAPGPWTTSLELAEAMVRRGVPFRSAHRAVGALAARLDGEGRTLADATPADLAAASPLFDRADLAALDPRAAVVARTAPGSASPQSVHEQIAALRRVMGSPA
jgi:argininosuccinate lyase